MIKFGTSGFRGIIDKTFTKEAVQKIGFAFRAFVTKRGHRVKIIVGHDNRLKGRDFARDFCEAAYCDLIDITFMEMSVTTPFIAFKARTFDYGIMITASHNPCEYNGFAVLLHGGRDADDGFWEQMAGLLDKTDTKITPFKKIPVKFCDDISDYIDTIVGMVDVKTIKSAKPKILFDAMHGSGTQAIKQLFQKIGVQYNAINDTVDTNFGGRIPAPYAYNLGDTASKVVAGKYDFGFALDGDGDRIAVIGADGRFYDCNVIAAILVDMRRCGLVKTFLTSNLPLKVCKKYDLPVYETRVGFKFLGEVLQKPDVQIAAEQHGIALKELSLRKDAIGIVALVINAVAKSGKSIGELVDEIAARVNFRSRFMEYAYHFDGDTDTFIAGLLAKKPTFGGKVIGTDAFPDGYRARFANDFWAAARVSGNENNLVRLCVEMPTEKDCDDVIKVFEQFYKLTRRQK